MNKKKLGMMLASMGLVGVVAIGGTLAYFSAQTEQVTNTFTVGAGYESGDLKLYEQKVVKDSTSSSDTFGDYVFETGVSDAVTEANVGNDYENIVAGITLAKDPTVKLDSDISSRVFVSVTGLDELEEYGFKVMNGDVAGVDTTNWTKVKNIENGIVNNDSLTDDLNGIYVFNTIGKEMKDDLFTSIEAPASMKTTVDGVEVDITSEMLSQVKLLAAAVQAEGTTQDEALKEVVGGLGTFKEVTP